MSDNEARPDHEVDENLLGEQPEVDGPQTVDADEPPASRSWPTVSTPWGTPGDHLTGPIPRIRRREDGSLTHGEES